MVCVAEPLLQHPVVVANNSREFRVKIKQGVVFAHGLTVRAGKLGPERTNAFIQFLDLRFAKNSAWWLVLEPVHKRGEEVNVFHLDGCQLVLVVGLVLCWC
jgi:hypothetical protein